MVDKPAGKFRSDKIADPARIAAVRMVHGVTLGGSSLSEVMLEDWYRRLPPQQRGRAQRLATAALRFAKRADQAVRPFMAKPAQPRVQAILRVGLVEAMEFDIPIHAIVNDYVGICGQDRKVNNAKGMVNAVLRKAITDAKDKWRKMGVPTLPKWLRKPMMDAFGPAAVSRIELSHTQGAHIDITVKSDPEGWAEKLGGELMPTGSVRLPLGVKVTSLDGFEAGDWWVQDAAATLAAGLMATKAGETVLDLCAAPGGKTLQMAHTGADVTAVDLSADRLERLTQNLNRTGLQAKIIVDDILKFKADPVDAVLLDAPCSATGTIRRHPDLPFIKDGTGVDELVSLQKGLLRKAARLVKPGGRLVYCTCSLLTSEGEDQIGPFLAENPDFTVDTSLPMGADAEWVTPVGGLRTRPDYWRDTGGMDGFFMIRLNRAEA